MGPVPVLDEAVLLVSELCANAVLHTASGNNGRFEVAICLAGCGSRCETTDPSKNQRLAQRACSPAVGRGLQLVTALAESWGYGDDRDGRVVFFQMRW